MTPAAREAARLALVSTRTEWGSSRWSEHARCAMAAWLGYVRGVRPLAPVDAFEIGTLVHACRAYALAGVIEEGNPRDDNDVLDVVIEEGFDFDPRNVTEARRLLDAYVARWNADGGWQEVVAIERDMRTELFGKPLTGRADLLVKHAGRIAIPDYKTMAALSESIGSGELAAEYRTRPQFAQLSMLARSTFKLDYWPSVIVDIIVKVKVPRFRRVEVTFEDATIAWHMRAHEAACHAMSTITALEPCPNPNACAPRPGQRCAFFAWCHGAEDDRSTLYAVEPQAKEPNP